MPPIFDFKCKQCDNQYETLIMKIKDNEEEINETRCPACGSPDKEKLISQKTGFILKGSGWASDNYGGSRKRK